MLFLGGQSFHYIRDGKIPALEAVYGESRLMQIDLVFPECRINGSISILAELYCLREYIRSSCLFMWEYIPYCRGNSYHGTGGQTRILELPRQRFDRAPRI